MKITPVKSFVFLRFSVETANICDVKMHAAMLIFQQWENLVASFLNTYLHFVLCSAPRVKLGNHSFQLS